MTTLDGFITEQLTFEHTTKTVHRKGSGPAVIVMSEIPGITPAVIRFAESVSAAGCTVVMPHLFGEDGHEPTPGRIAKVSAKVCISKEFSMFARGQSSPVVTWLRKLAAFEHTRCGGPGVGAVGMCMTGGFALAMLVEPSVIAPVLSQPSLPVAIGPLRKTRAAGIDISGTDLATVKQRLADDADLCVLAYRFSEDPLVPEARFRFLQGELGDRFRATTFPSATRQDHSVLTEALQQQALNEVLAFFDSRLVNPTLPVGSVG
jgi:dienelactone hydrolase